MKHENVNATSKTRKRTYRNAISVGMGKVAVLNNAKRVCKRYSTSLLASYCYPFSGETIEPEPPSGE
eukprot:713907-Amphidinium_carterae.2